MTLSHYVMLTCDGCGNADYMPGKNFKVAWRCFKDHGWFTYKGKHFDDEQCKEHFLNVSKGPDNG